MPLTRRIGKAGGMMFPVGERGWGSEGEWDWRGRGREGKREVGPGRVGAEEENGRGEVEREGG